MIQLREYQKMAVDQLKESFVDKESAMVVSPTGSGKTLIIKSFIEDMLETDSSLKICVATHRLEILKNLEEIIDNTNVDFSTVIKLYKNLETYHDIDNLYDILIIDECHHIVAKTYRAVVSTVCRWHCGFTATPLRGYMPDYPEFIPIYDYTWQAELTGIMGEDLYKKAITTIDTERLIGMNYLSDYEIVHDIPFHIKHTGSKNLDYTKKEIDDVITFEEAAKYIHKTKGSKKGIVFCHSVEFATKLDKLLGDISVLITSKTKRDERDSYFEKFKQGGVDLLINVDIFSEGVDVPAVDCVYLFRPTRSIPVFFQQIGRALRYKEGKGKAIVYDYVNNIARLGVEPRQMKLKDMLLRGSLARENCGVEGCKAYGVIESDHDRVSLSIPTNETRIISKWLRKNIGKYDFEYDQGIMHVRLKEESAFKIDDLYTYYSLINHTFVKSYKLPVILNQYNTWEMKRPSNISRAKQVDLCACFEFEGKCKYSEMEHKFYLIENNFKTKKKKRSAKVKMNT